MCMCVCNCICICICIWLFVKLSLKWTLKLRQLLQCIIAWKILKINLIWFDKHEETMRSASYIWWNIWICVHLFQTNLSLIDYIHLCLFVSSTSTSTEIGLFANSYVWRNSFSKSFQESCVFVFWVSCLYFWLWYFALGCFGENRRTTTLRQKWTIYFSSQNDFSNFRISTQAVSCW